MNEIGPRNRRFAELLREVNEAQAARRRSKRETVSDIGVAIFFLFVAVVLFAYWGRHV